MVQPSYNSTAAHLDAVEIDCSFRDEDVIAENDGRKRGRPICQRPGLSLEVNLV